MAAPKPDATPKTAREIEIHEIQQLRAPFTASAIRFKIQAGGGTKQAPSKALMVPYIDARLVIERLNHVVGFDWSAAYRPVDGALECALTVRGTTRIDVGIAEGSAQGGRKAWYSDALKRAAVHFGIGVSVYALPKMRLDPADLYYGSNGKVAGLSFAGEKKLRDGYETWLKGPGKAAFGAAIDHGDAPEAIGDHEVTRYESEEGDVEPAAPASKEEKQQARGAVAAAASGPRTLTPVPPSQQQAPAPTGKPVPDAEEDLPPAESAARHLAAADEFGDPLAAAKTAIANASTPKEAAEAEKLPTSPPAGSPDMRSVSEMAADAMCGPDGWMPRGQSAAAKDERAMITMGLCFLSDKTEADLPKTWPARGVMAYGLLGDAVQSRDEFLAALTAACNMKAAQA